MTHTERERESEREELINSSTVRRWGNALKGEGAKSEEELFRRQQAGRKREGRPKYSPRENNSRPTLSHAP